MQNFTTFAAVTTADYHSCVKYILQFQNVRCRLVLQRFGLVRLVHLSGMSRCTWHVNAIVCHPRWFATTMR